MHVVQVILINLSKEKVETVAWVVARDPQEAAKKATEEWTAAGTMPNMEAEGADKYAMHLVPMGQAPSLTPQVQVAKSLPPHLLGNPKV